MGSGGVKATNWVKSADFWHTSYNPDQLIFLDESSKDERTLSRQYEYSLKNTCTIQKVVFLRGTRYTILPALSLDGILAVDIMVGSCNKERFCNFILTQVVSIYILLHLIFIQTSTRY